jgi:hypothetical protein
VDLKTSDEFNEFSWYAEGLNNRPTGGRTWRTNFGYAPVQHLGSRTLGSNGELQVYTDRGFRGTAPAPLGIHPFRIVNGNLEIVGDKGPENVRRFISNYEYTGLITSQFCFSQAYGVFEMRAHAKGTRIVANVLALAKGWFVPPEIDILEILGHEPAVLHTNAHSKASGTHTDAPAVIRVADTSADFHSYAVEWQKDEIRWYFDGFEVARAPTPEDMHKPMVSSKSWLGAMAAKLAVVEPRWLAMIRPSLLKLDNVVPAAGLMRAVIDFPCVFAALIHPPRPPLEAGLCIAAAGDGGIVVPRVSVWGTLPPLPIHSSCSASPSQKAASYSNAIAMDGPFACAARCLASAALCRYISTRDDISPGNDI